MTHVARAMGRWATTIIAITVAAVSQAGVIEKAPDLGPFWQPLNPDGGSYIYANSFVADETGFISELGFWARDEDLIGGDAQLNLQVYGAGALPDVSNVVTETGLFDIVVSDTLQLFTGTPLPGGMVTAGTEYWFAASVIGSQLPFALQAGGHTQNSGGIVDNGTFWASNNPAGATWDFFNTPEIAFRVVIEGASAPVPAPTTIALLGLGLAAFGWKRRNLS